MSSLPRQSEIPKELQVGRILDADGAAYVGAYKTMASGSSRGCLVPKTPARMIGLELGEDVHTWIDVSRGLVVHKVGDLDDVELEEFGITEPDV